jgi:hypothetical protein
MRPPRVGRTLQFGKQSLQLVRRAAIGMQAPADSAVGAAAEAVACKQYGPSCMVDVTISERLAAQFGLTSVTAMPSMH